MLYSFLCLWHLPHIRFSIKVDQMNKWVGDRKVRELETVAQNWVEFLVIFNWLLVTWLMDE